MEAYAAPLRRLAELLRGFVARPASARALHVTTDRALRDAVVELVLGMEHHADNRSPFVRFDHPLRADGSCWAERASALRELHEARREAMAAHGYSLPALGAPPAGAPLVRFALALAQVAGARCPPLEGLVVVLAPSDIEGDGLQGALASLLAARELQSVRCVVVQVGPPSTRALAGLERADARVDEAEAQSELSRRIDAAAAAPLDAPGPAQVGAAWPRGVSPPAPKRGLPAGDPTAMAAKLGVPAGLFGTAIREVRPLLLRSALAMRAGDPLVAARFSTRAVERCQAAGLEREALLLEMVTATFVLHANQRDLAEGRYRGCADRARDRGYLDLAAQAWMAVGSVRLVTGDRPGASIAYAKAGRAARDGGERTLAIEGYRMAGQLAAEDGNAEVAARLWGEALATAQGMPEAEAARTSAPLAARQLAGHFRRLGLADRAASLDATAARMEQASA